MNDMTTDPTRAALLALAERCEQASGPDDVLDADIFLVMQPDLAAFPWERVTYPNGKHPFFADCSDPDGLNVVLPPRYTASLDAALSLVPDGWKWTLHSADTAGPPCAYCVPNMGRLPWPMWVNDVSAATPALALCAATLRARAEEAGNGE